MESLAKIGLILFLLCTLVPASAYSAQLKGEIQSTQLTELSGLVSSTTFSDHLWAINDGGHPPYLYLLGPSGAVKARYKVDARNKDWEALSQFHVGDRSLLVIADSGNNRHRRNRLTLYLIDEPQRLDHQKNTLSVVKQVAITFNKGAIDGEGIAYDPRHQQMLMVSKRDEPNWLYRIPFSLKGPDKAIAQPLVALQPLEDDRQQIRWVTSARKHLHRPTDMAMNIQGDLAILTYDRIYLWHNQPNQRIEQVIQQRAPQVIILPPLRQAEAITFTLKGDALVVSGEDQEPPLWQIAVPPAP